MLRWLGTSENKPDLVLLDVSHAQTHQNELRPSIPGLVKNVKNTIQHYSKNISGENSSTGVY